MQVAELFCVSHLSQEGSYETLITVNRFCFRKTEGTGICGDFWSSRVQEEQCSLKLKYPSVGWMSLHWGMNLLMGRID